MLTALVRFAVSHRGIVVALGGALLLYGGMSLTRAKYDVFPEFAPPQVAIQTEAPGLSPEQVELLVTKPIEDAVNGAAGVAVVRSQSIQGLSAVTVIFAEATDIYRARQAIAERLTEVARRLPATARAPVLTPLTSSTSTIVVIGLTSATRTFREQRTFADWTLRPRLLAVPGVARVSVFGGEVRQLQILLDPERLRAHRQSIADAIAVAGEATGVRGAGFLDNLNQRVVVRAEGQLATPEALAGAVVRDEGGVVLRLGDLGRAIEGSEPRVGAAAIEGVPGVVLVVSAQLGANTRDVTTAVERSMAELAPLLRAERLEYHPALFRPANFIDLALRNLRVSLLLGGVLVGVVVVLFLLDIGAIAVSLAAIPLSLLAAVLVLQWLGFSINTLTLGGLGIAIGSVVDDAIIDVENIARRLRENRARPDPRPAARVVFEASLEVRQSIIFATVIVALVFLPVMGMSGVEGALFRPLAYAHTLAILASLLVALTVTPALAALLLVRRNAGAREPWLLGRLKRRFVPLLDRLLDRPVPLLVGTGALTLAALAVFPLLGGEFLPEFREGHFVIHMQAVPGTSLDESLRLGEAVTRVLRSDPRVRSVSQRAGRAELADDTWGTHYSELEVDLVPLDATQAERIRGDLRARLAQIPGVVFAIKPFLTERMEEVLSGATAQVVIKLFGTDLDSLDGAAREVAAIVNRVPGATEVQSGAPPVVPEVLVRLRPDGLSELGVPAGAALRALEAATQGTVVSQVFEGNRTTDVVVRLDPIVLQHATDIRQVPVASAGGRLVLLSQVADIELATGRYAVAHEGARRLQTVTANTVRGDVGGFTSELQARLAAARLPAGVYAEVSGTGTAQQAARRRLLLNSLFVLAAIVMLLYLAFKDSRRVLLVLLSMPFALVGGVLAVFLTGTALSLGALVGFVTLFGIAMRNTIMLILHYDHLLAVEGAVWGRETALRGAAERLGPILMTALVTGLGLLPLALGSGAPGREIEGPLAIVILGGLSTSTALSLLVVPMLALRYGRFERAAQE